MTSRSNQVPEIDDMNRVIKFRAWDKESQSMLTQDCWQFNFSNTGNYKIIAINEFSIERDVVAPIEIMQFTGQTDKNGKEIYDGDILRGSTSMGYINFKEVVWEQDKLRFYCYPQGRADKDWFDRVSTIEVIGNIYENPELLTTNGDK